MVKMGLKTARLVQKMAGFGPNIVKFEPKLVKLALKVANMGPNMVKLGK